MASTTRSPRRRECLATLAVALGSVGLAGCADLLDRAPGEPGADDDSVSGDGATAAADADDTEPTDTDDESDLHADYETTTVTVSSPDGDQRGSVTAAIADTRDLRYLGLSDTDSLPEDRGMLFVFDAVDDRTFVMREMDFGIDIVYADEEGVITEIHHAPAPEPDEDGESQRYPGRGQYVLEVVYEWTTDRGVTEGDRLEFDL